VGVQGVPRKIEGPSVAFVHSVPSFPMPETVFHLDVSFHTKRMIALSDICKSACRTQKVQLRRIILTNMGSTPEPVIYRYDCAGKRTPMWCTTVDKEHDLSFTENVCNFSDAWNYLELISQNPRNPRRDEPICMRLWITVATC
jgi:hypothetical protein